MFGRKIPEAKTEDTLAKPTDSSRTTSYRQGQDTAPPTVGVRKTTSYVNAMQLHERGFDSIN
ncbi:MAG TPA: hypothetical protein VFO16_15065 [Pseudonocardiaceae bacterium]|nr:hypothetical protein [Pseudonocardiaceae bacterium]